MNAIVAKQCLWRNCGIKKTSETGLLLGPEAIQFQKTKFELQA